MGLIRVSWFWFVPGFWFRLTCRWWVCFVLAGGYIVALLLYFVLLLFVICFLFGIGVVGLIGFKCYFDLLYFSRLVV